MGLVILIHGYGEHGYRPQYEYLHKFVQTQGWRVERHVLQNHWNGTPDSPPPSYYFDHFDRDLLQPLLLRVEEARVEGEERIVLVGKSLGGLLAIRCAEESRSVSGVVALSPCLRIGPKYDSPIKRALAYLAVDWLGLARWFYSPFDQLAPADVTRKEEEYATDPHVLSRGVWAAVAVATRNETFTVHERSDRIACPVLILHGSDDLVCDCAASEQLSSAPSVTLHSYEKTAHDLLDEPPEVVDDIYTRIREFLGNH